MTKIIGEPMPWPNSTPEDIQQNYVDTCAVKSQQIVMKSFGLDIPEDVLALESEIKDYYHPGYGSDPEQVGKLLNDHGIPTHSQENASVYDLVNELAQGHKVIVGVDADELWRPSMLNDMFGEEANHAIVVTGIDTTDPDNVKVIVTDPGSGDVAKSYSVDQFVDAWHDSNCFYVATDNAIPVANNPEMAGFNYDAGHIPFIGNIPYVAYESFVDEFSIFHDDIINNMNQCIEKLNDNVTDDEIANMSNDIEMQFNHMHDVEHFLQDNWNDTLQTNSTNICHSLLNDCWNWETNTSTIPDNIDCMDFDF